MSFDFKATTASQIPVPLESKGELAYSKATGTGM